MNTCLRDERRRAAFIPLLVALFIFLSASLVVPAFWSGETIANNATLIDDGFYALTIARHIALGHGITIDGVTPTNGFQPLWVFLLVPAFWVGGQDLILPLRLVLIFSGLIGIATALVLGLIAKSLFRDTTQRQWAFWGAAILFVSNYVVFSLVLNGLETGLLLLMVAVTLWLLQNLDLEQQRNRALLGVVLGLLILTRIDTVFLVGLVSVWLFLALRGTFVKKIAGVALTVGLAVVVSAPWWLYNFVAFGSLMPTSGRAQQGGVTEEQFVFALREIVTVLVPFAPLPAAAQLQGTFVVRLVILLAAIVALFLLWKRRGFRLEFGNSNRLPYLLALLVIYGVMLAGWYALTSFAVWHYIRYFSVGILVFAVLGAAALTRGALYAPVLMTGLLALTSLTVPVRTWLNYEVPGRGTATFGEQLALTRAYVPPTETVAALQTGTLGYFRERVVNLDGKVNAEALQHHPWSPTESTLSAYLIEKQIYYVVDLKYFLPSFLGPRAAQEGWRELAAADSYVVYTR